MILIDSYIKFLTEHKLSQGQFLLLILIHKNRADLIRTYKEAFPTEDGTMIGQYFIDELFTKGFLAKTQAGSVYVTELFLSQYIDKHEATEEVFSVYPTHFTKDGVNIPLSAMDRNIFANLYDQAIMSCIGEHIEVMKDIEFAIKHNLLNIGIDKFVKSKYWMMIRPQRLEGITVENTPTIRDYDF